MDVHQEKLHAAQSAIIRLFEQIHPVSESLGLAIKQNSELIIVPEKKKLLSIGETQKSIYFIFEGAARIYNIDQDGNQNTSWLLLENELAISVFSFFSQKTSFEVLETLEHSTLLVMSYAQLSKLYQIHPEFNFIGRVITEHYYIQSEEKANELRMLPAKERYAKLLKRKPEILCRVPLGILASYLGMTQSTLSRIRAGKG